MADGNTTDFSIPLGVKSPYQMVPQQSPFEIMNTMAEVNNRQNQAKLFQQQFQAKERAGQIIAASPNLDAAFGLLAKDPLVAPFAGGIINEYRQGMLTLQQMQQSQAETQRIHGETGLIPYRAAELSASAGEKLAQTGRIGIESEGLRQGQAESTFSSWMKMLPSAYDNPDMLGKVTASIKASTPPAVWAQVGDKVQNLERSLTEGLPMLDPQARLAEYQKRLGTIMVASGAGAQIQHLAPSPTSVDVKSGEQFGTVVPAGRGEASGQFNPAGSQVPFGVAPHILETPSGRPGLVGGPNPLTITPLDINDRATLDQPGANPLMPQTGPVQAQPPATGLATTPAGTTPIIGQDNKPMMTPMGTPLVVPNSELPKTSPLSWSKVQTADYEEQNKNIRETVNKQAAAAQLAQSQLAMMDNAFNKLASGGGADKLLTPGWAGESRTGMVKAINTMLSIAGQEPLVNPEKMAEAELIRKYTTNLGFSNVTQNFGVQREASTVIERSIAAVPGIENTVLGARILSDSLKAFAQRAIQEQQYINVFMQKSQGNPTNALESFNKLYPTQDYAQTVMAKYGITPDGQWTSPKSIRQAELGGLITHKQAVDAFQQQFAKGQ